MRVLAFLSERFFKRANKKLSIGTSDLQPLINDIGGCIKFINSISSQITSFSVGMVLPFAAETPPSGFLLCDGSAVSRATFSDLFDSVGTTYGVGDGSTTFNVPDLRQRFPLGKASSGTGSTLGGTGGLIDHIHTANPPSTVTSSPTGVSPKLAGAEDVSSDTHTHTVDIPEFNTGSNNPPFLALNFIIKV